MTRDLDPRVAQIRAAAREATGSDSAELISTVEFLEKSGRELYAGDEDLVLYKVYRDITVKGRVRTFADLVIAGNRTLKEFPRVEEFGFHFRKRYTADSPPLARGETPAVEFERTTRAVARMPTAMSQRLRPLAADEWVYRSRVVPGQTFAALSPFSDLPYEKAMRLVMLEPEPSALTHRIESSFSALESMHAVGVAHGDLHLDNIMWIADEPEAPAQPIDLASALFQEDSSAQAWEEALFDDLNELMRESALLQLCLGRTLPGACAERSLAQLGDLFPEEMVRQFSRLS